MAAAAALALARSGAGGGVEGVKGEADGIFWGHRSNLRVIMVATSRSHQILPSRIPAKSGLWPSGGRGGAGRVVRGFAGHAGRQAGRQALSYSLVLQPNQFHRRKDQQAGLPSHPMFIPTQEPSSVAPQGSERTSKHLVSSLG